MEFGVNMQIEKLNKKNIKEFSKTLKNIDANSSVLEIFFDTIIDLINPYETNFSKNIQKIISEYKVKNIDDVNTFLKKYNVFTNSSVDVVNEILLAKDLEKFNRDLGVVFKTLYDESKERDSYKILHTKIDQVLIKMVEVYEIDMVDDFHSMDDFLNQVSEVFQSSEIALQITMLVTGSLILKEEKIDEVELEGYFTLALSIISVLNEFRKNELQRVEDDKFFTPRTIQEETRVSKAGRNGPCPCGSGKKYKKCCLITKQEQKINPLDVLDTPIATYFSLTRAEVDAFYSLWSRLINFTDNLLCYKRGKKHKKIYFKDGDGKYTLTQHALENNYYIDSRNFLLINFDRIVDDFINSSRVSKENIDLLEEWKKHRLYSDNFLIYESTQVGVVIYDAKDARLYHLHDLYDRVYDLSKRDTMLSMLLLPYKGRIIFDGIIGHMGIEFGQNSKDMFLKSYIALREKDEINTTLPKQSNTTNIYQLKISIKGAKPPIWRRVLIEDDLTYRGVHYIIQNIFEWNNSHLFEFVSSTRRYTDLDDDFMDSIGESVDKFTIGDDLKEIGDKIEYIYDFGDHWEHEVKLEDILEKKEHESYPKCIKGKGEGPLENIGGIWAYNEMLKAYKAGDKERLEEFCLEDDFELFEFDIDEVNARLR